MQVLLLNLLGDFYLTQKYPGRQAVLIDNEDNSLIGFEPFFSAISAPFSPFPTQMRPAKQREHLDPSLGYDVIRLTFDDNM